MDFLGIVYGILSRKQLKLRVILGKKWYTGGGSGLSRSETIYKDTRLELWRAGAIVLSSGRILAQRKNLLTKEVAPWEFLSRKNLLRRIHNICIDQKQSSF